jgi:hypothetical protein
MHESTTDTISTNGDYSVFVNHPKDFVLKLTLNEAGESMNHKSQTIDDAPRYFLTSYSYLVIRFVADAHC